MLHWRAAFLVVLLALTAPAAGTGFESWKIDEIYSNADGTKQYVVLKEAQRLGYAEADPTGDVEGFE